MLLGAKTVVVVGEFEKVVKRNPLHKRLVSPVVSIRRNWLL